MASGAQRSIVGSQTDFLLATTLASRRACEANPEVDRDCGRTWDREANRNAAGRSKPTKRFRLSPAARHPVALDAATTATRAGPVRTPAQRFFSGKSVRRAVTVRSARPRGGPASLWSVLQAAHARRLATDAGSFSDVPRGRLRDCPCERHMAKTAHLPRPRPVALSGLDQGRAKSAGASSRWVDGCASSLRSANARMRLNPSRKVFRMRASLARGSSQK
jgi:hypothetical protein